MSYSKCNKRFFSRGVVRRRAINLVWRDRKKERRESRFIFILKGSLLAGSSFDYFWSGISKSKEFASTNAPPLLIQSRSENISLSPGTRLEQHNKKEKDLFISPKPYFFFLSSASGKHIHCHSGIELPAITSHAAFERKNGAMAAKEDLRLAFSHLFWYSDYVFSGEKKTYGAE